MGGSEPASPGAAAGELLLAGGRIVTPDEVIADGWVHLAGGRVRAVGRGTPPRDGPRVDLTGAWLLPGFIDLHMHGGGGHGVADSPAAMAAAADFHATRGTTGTLVSLMTASVQDLVEQLGWATALMRDTASRRGGGRVLGAHLEGPFLSAQRCGAQPAAHMRAPDPAVLETLLAAADGSLAMCTLAPELPGAPELIDRLVTAGVIAALGHSDASYEQAMAAVAAGARQATHLHNAMSPLTSRAPGLVGAVLDADLPAELIVDGHHLHPATVRLAFSQLTRPLLITDAIAAAGAGDGEFALGGQAVTVADGVARLGDGTLAGSTLTMDRALAGAVLGCGVDIVAASRAASGAPARQLGIADRTGAISPGLAADLVLLDDALAPSDVMIGGRWVGGTTPRQSAS